MVHLSNATKLMVLGRLALAAGCFTSPDLTAGVLGFPERSPTTRAFARMLGMRDLAMALVLVATASDDGLHKRAVQIAGLVDAGDVAAISIGAINDPRMRAAAVRNLPLAGGSALFCFLVARAS